MKSIIEVLENMNSQQQQHLVNTPQNVGLNENYMVSQSLPGHVEPTKTRINYVDSRTTPRTGELSSKFTPAKVENRRHL